jgi:hypothetical protein
MRHKDARWHGVEQMVLEEDKGTMMEAAERWMVEGEDDAYDGVRGREMNMTDPAETDNQ